MRPGSVGLIDQGRSIVQRFASTATHAGLLDRMVIEPGTMQDYRGLAHFHYRGHHPGAVVDVLRATRREPTVVGRWLQRPERCEVLGVLVRSLPQLCCQLRDLATHGRYRGLR